MINYDEEIQRFTPSVEIDDAEDAIFKSDTTDLSDVIEKLNNPKGATRQ